MSESQSSSGFLQVTSRLTTADLLQEQQLENAVVLHLYLTRQPVSPELVNSCRLTEIATELDRCSIQKRRTILREIRAQRAVFVVQYSSN